MHAVRAACVRRSKLSVRLPLARRRTTRTSSPLRLVGRVVRMCWCFMVLGRVLESGEGLVMTEPVVEVKRFLNGEFVLLSFVFVGLRSYARLSLRLPVRNNAPPTSLRRFGGPSY